MFYVYKNSRENPLLYVRVYITNNELGAKTYTDFGNSRKDDATYVVVESNVQPDKTIPVSEFIEKYG